MQIEIILHGCSAVQQDTDIMNKWELREVLWVTSKGNMCSEMFQLWNWWYSQVVCVCCVCQGVDEQTWPPNTGLQPDVKQCDWCRAACWLPEAPRLCLWAESKLKQSTEQQEAFSSIVCAQLDYIHTLNGLLQSQTLLQPSGNQKNMTVLIYTGCQDNRKSPWNCQGNKQMR